MTRVFEDRGIVNEMTVTREYPSVPVVELAPEPIPAWAIVAMTLAFAVNAVLWPLVAILCWRHWHG